MNLSTGAESTHWDLSDLYPSPDHSSFKADQERLRLMAASFLSEYRGQVAQLDAHGLAQALISYEEIQDLAGKLGSYAYLSWATDTLHPDNGRLLQEMTEFGSQVSQDLIFFSVEWVTIEQEKAETLIHSPLLSRWRHYLETSRLYKEHTLDEKQEQVISLKSVSGRNAWIRLFDETLSSASFDYDGELLTEQEVLSKLHSPDRETRQKAAESLTVGLKNLSRPLTYIFNTLLVDKKISDELRKYPNWLSSRNLSNEISDSAVQSLIDSVMSRYDIAQRYYRLKAKLLGLEGQMKDYDRYAPVLQSETKISWQQARELVTEAYSGFDHRLGDIVAEFFDKQWIDAAIKPGKRNGAFSASTVPSVHPYILMNYDGRIRDVQTLAHELGHGVHQYLSRENGVLQADTPLTTAETASVFGEMLVFRKIYESLNDPKEKLSMLVGKMDDTMATVYRQIAMNRFEDAAHTARRNLGELRTEQLNDIWRKTQVELYGDSVTLTSDYDYWWSYIPHFIHSPGYVYAYAFGELLVMSLYQQYLQQPEGFQDNYISILKAGGSDWPEKIIAPTGLDITDVNFWKKGIASIEDLLQEAETLAHIVMEKS